MNLRTIASPESTGFKEQPEIIGRLREGTGSYLAKAASLRRSGLNFFKRSAQRAVPPPHWEPIGWKGIWIWDFWLPRCQTGQSCLNPRKFTFRLHLAVMIWKSEEKPPIRLKSRGRRLRGKNQKASCKV